VKFASHNIDTLRHAAALLDVWLYWFNAALSTTSYFQPQAI